MNIALIALCSFFASWISFYSGFGLGTLLMPVVAIFFPLPIAIGLTAIVHLAHNSLKTALLWQAIDWKTTIRFGGAAVLFAIPGAWLLQRLSEIAPIRGAFAPLNLVIGCLLIALATTELFPKARTGKGNLFLGGAISGFFGGLTGNQGAFRSAFLIHSRLGAESFIGTNAIIAVAVDIVRLAIYGFSFWYLLKTIDLPLLVTAIISSLVGVGLGMLFLRKMTVTWIQKTIIALLYLFGILIALGLIS